MYLQCYVFAHVLSLALTKLSCKLTAVVSMVTVFFKAAPRFFNFEKFRASTMFELPRGSAGKMPHPTDTRQATSVLMVGFSSLWR